MDSPLSREERDFVDRMSYVDNIRNSISNMYPTQWVGVAREVERCLKEAGLVLGYRARFYVTVLPGPKVHVLPTNGAAQRMLDRYEVLVLQHELSKG